MSELFVRPSGPGPGGYDDAKGGGGSAAPAAPALLPPIRPAGGGSFASGIGGAPSDLSAAGAEGDPSRAGNNEFDMFAAFPSSSSAAGSRRYPQGGGGALRDNGYGGGGGGTKVDTAVQTVPSGEQPAMWQEVAAVDALHQSWSTSSAPTRFSASVPPVRKSFNAIDINVDGNAKTSARGGRGGGVGRTAISGGGGGDVSFARSGMKQSYNFSSSGRSNSNSRR